MTATGSPASFDSRTGCPVWSINSKSGTFCPTAVARLGIGVTAPGGGGSEGGAGADPKRWKFLTGDPKKVADVASSFGILYYPDKGQVIHQQGVAIIAPDGTLTSIYYGESWEAEHVLRDLEKARKG